MTKKPKLYYLGAALTIMGIIAFILFMVHHFQHLADDANGLWAASVTCLGATIMNMNNAERNLNGERSEY